jgi:hypothetical protein
LKAQHISSGIPLIIRRSKLYSQPLVYIHMSWQAVVRARQRPVTTCVYKPEAANTVWSSWWWAVCRSKHVEPSINFGIINSNARLHLVGYFYWLNFCTQHNTRPCSLKFVCIGNYDDNPFIVNCKHFHSVIVKQTISTFVLFSLCIVNDYNPLVPTNAHIMIRWNIC